LNPDIQKLDRGCRREAGTPDCVCSSVADSNELLVPELSKKAAIEFGDCALPLFTRAGVLTKFSGRST
jgi:ATP-dependent helicase YprA (DUF1998 family)